MRTSPASGRNVSSRTALLRLRIGCGVALLAGCLGLSAAAQQQTETPPAAQQSPFVQPPDVVSSHCPQPLAHHEPSGTVTSGDWVELQRTGCYGSCPSYTVRLYANGAVHWHGDRLVEVMGSAGAQVDPVHAANLIQQLRDHGFESLCGSYARPITDNATYLTTVSVAGHAFTVKDYASSAPAWLRDFDDDIDAAANTHRWRHGEAATEHFGNLHLEQDAQYPKPGRTELMRAAGSANGAIHLLLEQKVAVDAEDASGWTALMYAAGDGSTAQVRQLLAAGANAARLSRAGESLLFAAAGSADDPVGKLKLLEKAGADPAVSANDGTTVLMIAAARYQQTEILRAVLALGANPSVRNAAGQTALNILDQAWARDNAPADEASAYRTARALLLHAH